MSPLRRLFLALLLPALLLPDGITLCLRTLVGAGEAGCCAKACCASAAKRKRAPTPATTPTLKRDGCEGCCVTLPPSDRPASEPRDAESIARAARELALAAACLAPPAPPSFALAECAPFLARGPPIAASRPPPRGTLPLLL